MAGNRIVFDEALQRSRDALQEGAWPEALQEALRATDEFPEDLQALAAGAYAFFHSGAYTQTIQRLESVRRAGGADATVLSYLARAYQHNNQIDRAVAVLDELAEHCLELGEIADAREAWEEAIQLDPYAEAARIHLAELLVDSGESRLAAEQCVAIAQMRYEQNDMPGAHEALDEALGLDPSNNAAQILGALLKAAAPMTAPTLEPLHSVIDTTLSADQAIARGTQEQALGHGTAALEWYQRAIELGIDRADVHFNLGTILQEQNDHAGAIVHLQRAATDPEYGVSAHYMLGASFQALGNPREAARAYEEALTLIDTRSMSRGDTDDLITIYEAAAQVYIGLGETSRAASLYGTLAALFQSKRWGKELTDQFAARAKELTARSMSAKLRNLGTGNLHSSHSMMLDAERASGPSQSWGTVGALTGFLRGDQGPDGDVATQNNAPDPFAGFDIATNAESVGEALTPLSTEGCSELTQQLVVTAEHFAEQGLLYAAIDACHEVIRTDPGYLPIHLRLAELLERIRDVRQAAQKYRALIDAYTVMERSLEAIDAYYHLIKVSTDALDARIEFVALLRNAGRISEAVPQALLVANSYIAAGHPARAIEEFQQIAAWAPPSAPLLKAYGLALFKEERWEQALECFQQAVTCEPRDPLALAEYTMALAVLGRGGPQLWEVFQRLLEVLHEEPEQSAAVQDEYRKALLMIDAVLLQYLLGILQQTGGQFASAMLSFQQALVLQEEDPSPSLPSVVIHQALAASYIVQDQKQEALAELEQVGMLLQTPIPNAQELPAFARPWTELELQQTLASLSLSSEDLQTVGQQLQRRLQEDPEDVGAYRHLAEIYFRQGKLQQALDQWEHLADLYEKRHQLDQAISVLEDATRLAPTMIGVRAHLGRVLLRRGLLERGLEQLTEVAHLQKNAGIIYDAAASLQRVAEVYWMLGKIDSALDAYRSIVTIRPDDIESRLQLVSYYLLANRTSEALLEQGRLVDLLLQQNNNAEALPALHQLLALDPDDQVRREQLATLMAQMTPA